MTAADPPPAIAHSGAAPGKRPGLVVRLLQVQVLLLTLIPQRLVVAPLGAAGSPAQIVGLALFGLWAISVLHPGTGVNRRCGPLRLVLVLFWCSTLVSYAVMHFHEVPTDEMLSADRFLLNLAAFSGIALCAAEGLRDRTEVLRVLRVALWGVAGMALVALLQFRTSIDLTTYIARIPLLSSGSYLVTVQARGGFTRPPGTAIHPIEFAVVVATALGPAIALAVYDLGRSRFRRWVPLVLIGLGVPISVSRSALLVVVVVLVMFLTGASPALRTRGAVAVAGSSMVIFVIIPGMIGTLKDLVLAGESDSSISTRTSDYAAVSRYLRQSPWIGRGPGTFLPKYRILDNQYLMSFIETGIIGALILLVLFATIATLGRGARSRYRDEGDRLLGQMLAACGVASSLAAATFDALSFPTFTFMVALWFGLAGAWWRLSFEVAAPVDVPPEITVCAPLGYDRRVGSAPG